MERKFLEGLGITDKETIDKILDQNGAEVGALNTRIKTKDTEISTLRTDLTAANGRVAELEKVDVTQLEKDLADERAGRAADRKAWALESLLVQSGCTDTDYIKYKLGDSVQYDDDGKIKDPENAVKDWQEKFPTFFKSGTDGTDEKPAGTGSAGNFGRNHDTRTPASKNPYTKEGWNLTEQCRLEMTDPEKAKKLRNEAEM